MQNKKDSNTSEIISSQPILPSGQTQLKFCINGKIKQYSFTEKTKMSEIKKKICEENDLDPRQAVIYTFGNKGEKLFFNMSRLLKNTEIKPDGVVNVEGIIKKRKLEPVLIDLTTPKRLKGEEDNEPATKSEPQVISKANNPFGNIILSTNIIDSDSKILGGQVQNSNSDVSVLNKHIGELKKKAEMYEHEIKEQNKQVAEKNEILNALQSQLQQCELEVKNLNDTVTSLNAIQLLRHQEVQQLLEENKTLKDTITALSGQKLQEMFDKEKEGDKSQFSEDRLCCICLVNEKDTVLMDCRHCCVCTTCAGTITNCPLCQSLIKQRTRIYN